MNGPIEVIDIKKKKNKQYKAPITHADLPQLSFAMCIIGPRGRGKSLLIRNLLLRDDMLKKTFKKPNYIVIISPSLSNGDYDEVEGKNVYKYDFFDPSVIDHLIATQKGIIEKHSRKKAPEILVIMDDILDQKGAISWGSKTETIFARGRHVNINCVLVSQHLNRVSKTIRINSDYFILFSPNNIAELENFYEQYIPRRYWWGMDVYLKDMWARNPYQFILVDFKTHDKDRRFREGFSEPIILENLSIKPKK